MGAANNTNREGKTDLGRQNTVRVYRGEQAQGALNREGRTPTRPFPPECRAGDLPPSLRGRGLKVGMTGRFRVSRKCVARKTGEGLTYSSVVSSGNIKVVVWALVVSSGGQDGTTEQRRYHAPPSLHVMVMMGWFFHIAFSPCKQGKQCVQHNSLQYGSSSLHSCSFQGHLWLIDFALPPGCKIDDVTNNGGIIAHGTWKGTASKQLAFAGSWGCRSHELLTEWVATASCLAQSDEMRSLLRGGSGKGGWGGWGGIAATGLTKRAGRWRG